MAMLAAMRIVQEAERERSSVSTNDFLNERSWLSHAAGHCMLSSQSPHTWIP